MDISNFKVYQQNAIKIALEQINAGNKRIAIATPPGSGRTLVGTTVINEFLKSETDGHPLQILVVTAGTGMQRSVAKKLRDDNALTVNLSILPSGTSRSEITVIPLRTIAQSTSFTSLTDTKKKFDLIVVIGGGPPSNALINVLNLYPDANHLAILDVPEKTEHFGDLLFQYTLREGIEDGSVYGQYFVVGMESNGTPYQSDISALDERERNEVLTSNMKFIQYGAKTLYDLVKTEKTIIFCPNTEFADQMALVLNKKNGTETFAAAAHRSNEFAAESSIVERYRDNLTEPMVLCVVTAAIHTIDLSLTKTIAIFRKTESAHVLQNMIIPCLGKYPKKEALRILDFVNLDDLFMTLDKDAVTNEMKLPHSERWNYFKKSSISFRDKKEIEGVMGVDDLADELAEIITIMPPEQGSMIGIFGRWGRGKTFLMEQTWNKLSKKERPTKFIKVDFHAWKYQDTPATWAYLYECISDVYLKPDQKCWISKIIVRNARLVWLNIQRKNFWPILKLLVIIFTGALGFILGKDIFPITDKKLKPLFDFFGTAFISSATIYSLYLSIKKDYSAKAKDLFLKYTTKHSFKEHLGLQAEIQKETLTLMKTWIPKSKVGKKKIILFVEDIDRCNELKIIQIIDSLRVLLEDAEIAQRMVIVAAVDERMLKLAIKMKYHSLIALEKTAEEHKKALTKVTDEYIDKLFIAGIRLGNLSVSDSDEFFSALTKSDRSNEELMSLDVLLKEESNFQYNRQSQLIQDAILDEHIERSQMQQDFYEYEEPEFATEYLENSQAIPQSTSNSPNQSSGAVQNINGKLSTDELNVLRIALTVFKGATPRQIRIFYYRYLIAKNLLIRRYKNLQRTNVWQSKPNCKILASLIIKYTINEEENELALHLEQALNDGHELHNVKLLRATSVSGFDYRELLKILSIVIAY